MQQARCHFNYDRPPICPRHPGEHRLSACMGNSSGGRSAFLRSWESHPSAVLAEPSFDGSIIIPFSRSWPPPGAAPAFAVDLYRSRQENALSKCASFPGSHGESLAGSLEKSRIRMCLMKCIFGCQGAYSSYLTALKLV